jgi:hypothetical protein
MSRPVSLLLVLSTIGCSNLATYQQAPLLTLVALQQAERIIPTPAGYLLGERKVAPRKEESGRQLALYDAQGNFQEAIRLFGAKRLGQQALSLTIPWITLTTLRRQALAF